MTIMELALLTLVLSFGSVFGLPVTYTPNLGVLEGTTFITRNGKNVSAYLGIPYAKAPIGPLRFKSPEKFTHEWSDVLMVDTEANRMCPQLNDDGVVVGDEDCLYLNVYTTEFEVWPEKQYPVMVYFHGGDFIRGSASSVNAGPEYLMDRDIVLVTVNYRLGVLGFLSTGDQVSPGNYGLKDQTLALQWVHDNIDEFTGDPDRVTIFGEGAGGASTSYHATFTASNGLFHNYISQSGSALSLWAFELPPVAAKHARDLGNYLNCSSSQSQELVDCLRDIDVHRLVDSNDIFDDYIWKTRTWVPTEETGPHAFVTDFPARRLAYSGLKHIPGMVGVVKDAGLFATADLYGNESPYNEMVKNLDTYVKDLVDILFVEDSNPMYMRIVRDYYFEEVESLDKDFIQNMTRLITDLAFRYPLNQMMHFKRRGTPDNIYFYEFDYRGSYSKTSDTTGSDKDIGVTVGDDLLYLFPTKKNPDFRPTESDEKMIDIVLDLWTSFAETGTPTSQSISEPNLWKGYGTGYGLKIGENSDPIATQMYLEMDETMEFWIGLVNFRIFDGLRHDSLY